ncbi:twin-arginine translocase subunit TatC [Ekhidna sp.]|jgi:sec-independent protein translocase protein TatC|uniref:twin-arginine translocase subunit TatC n=1 Tax=Ekhidna sp. TaxID=2608089 RepID=UPI0032EBCB5B
MPLDQIPDEKEMSFLDHLEELRWHIIRSLIAIVVIAIAAFAMKDFVIGTVILGPSRTDFWTYQKLCQLADLIGTPALCIDSLTFELVSRKLSSQFMTHVSVSFVVGLVLGFPYLFWEIWRFIKPGLRPQERKASRGATFSVSVLFMMGVLFGYFMIAPISVRFFSTYQVDPSLQNLFDLSSYINTVTLIIFGCGILFQLPVIVYFLTKAGIVSSALMKAYRKHSIIVILILGAIVTPPDPFSQILIALPLMMLYQFSIVIAKRIEKREARQNKES